MPEKVKRKLEAEIQQVEYELHNELPKELKKAIAHGDLSENAEYHSAKARQEILRAPSRADEETALGTGHGGLEQGARDAVGSVLRLRCTIRRKKPNSNTNS